MSRTPGARNKVKRLPRVDDVYGNVFLENSMNSKSAMPVASTVMNGGAWLFPQGILMDLYLTNGWGRRIVDVVAEDMTREGFKLEEVDEQVNSDIQSRIEELDAMKKLTLALKWARAFGGSGIVMGLADGGDFETPLNPDAVKNVEFLRVYDRFEITEVSRYSDPKKETFGRIEIYRISPSEGNVQPYDVHESRVLIFDGDPIPNRLRHANQGWGASILQKCLIEIQRIKNGHKWAELILERCQQAVHGIPNLSNLLADPEGEKLVTKRIDVVDRVRSVQNTVVIDAAETFEVKTQTLTGVEAIVGAFAEALSAVTGIPIYILMGQSPGGLASNSDGNEDAWHAQVANMQNEQLRKPLDLLVSMLMREKSQGGDDGGKYRLCFNPLSKKNDADVADAKLKEAQADYAAAQADQVYVNMGALDPEEVRNRLAEDEDYAEFIDLSIKPVPTAEKLLGTEAELAAKTGAPGSAGGTGSGSAGKKPAAKAPKKAAAKSAVKK